MLTPNGCPSLKEAKGKYGNLQGYFSWGGLSTQDKLREANKSGGLFIGIASDYSTLHSILTQMNVKVVSKRTGGNLIVGGKVFKLGVQSEKTSKNVEELQTAAVDAASEPVLDFININTVTGDVAMWLTLGGMSLEYTTALLNTPIIKDLANNVLAYTTLYGDTGAFENGLKETLKMYSDMSVFDLRKSLKSVDADISEGKLEDIIKDGSYNKIGNIEALKAFLTFRDYASDLSQLKTALKIDVKGPKQSTVGVFIQKERLANVSGTLKSQGGSSIIIDSKDYAKHSISAYEKYGIQGTSDLLSRVSVDSSKAVTSLITRYINSVSNYNEKDLRLLLSDFYTFLFTHQNAIEGMMSPLAPEMDSHFVANLLVGPESVGKRVVEMQRKMNKRARKDPDSKNQFLDTITVELSNEDTGFDIVKGNYSTSKALTREQKSDIANDFTKLLQSKDAKVKKLALDLIKYSLTTEGFNRSINSFSEYINPNIYNIIGKMKGETVIDYFNKVKEVLYNSPERVNTTLFLTKFFANRATILSGVEDLTGIAKTSFAKTLKSKNSVFKYSEDGVSYIGVLRGENKELLQITEVEGVENVQNSYVKGEPLHKLETVQQALEVALVKKELTCK